MNSKGVVYLVPLIFLAVLIAGGAAFALYSRQTENRESAIQKDFSSGDTEASATQTVAAEPQQPAPSPTSVQKAKATPAPAHTQTSPPPPTSPQPKAPTPKPVVSTDQLNWQLTGSGWQPSGAPPQCPDPFSIVPPADVSLATSVLYPGQYRGGNLYEPGGGFRFDNSSNDAITIRVPMDSSVVGGARFLVEGEMQYVFDLIAPCGVMFRYDHLLAITPEFQKIADRFPPAKENDTRTTFLNPQVPVSSGEVIATAVGLRKNNNAFISWSVFDLRQKNRISQEASSWAAEHPTLEHYAVCPYDFLSPNIQTIVYALPAADGVAGRTSDFCK